jgi:hypothetical protein
LFVVIVISIPILIYPIVSIAIYIVGILVLVVGLELLFPIVYPALRPIIFAICSLNGISLRMHTGMVKPGF